MYSPNNLDVLQKLRNELTEHIAEYDIMEQNAKKTPGVVYHNIYITGDQFNRILFLEQGDGSGNIIGFNDILENTLFYEKYIRTNLASWELQTAHIATIRFTEAGLRQLILPAVRLISLYHPENFPLPRFPLAISDIAAAIRQQFSGTVRLSDMQLNYSTADLLRQIETERCDIIGISATFGQHDLLETMLSGIQQMQNFRPLIIAGGSLAALNKTKLLEQYPGLIVATGYGESTMRDLIAYWHGLKPKHEINAIQYRNDDGTTHQTAVVKNDRDYAAWPELDLLRPILDIEGVMQLEISRGCTYACSFCPRDHKGVWSDLLDQRMPMMLDALRRIYRDFPQINKKLFLVDEEFVGYKKDEQTLERAMKAGEMIAEYGFRFESSTRIDQVVRPHKDDAWHIRRIAFWKKLARQSLSRMLFGVESGVDTILERFNKKTSADQNVQALRTLTALRVPLRITYITFDPLMTMTELIASFHFQGRTDIILEPLDKASAEEVLAIVTNQEQSEKHAAGIPLFKEISYMLVSMECLLGSPYLRQVEAEGLAGELSLSMGRRHAVYRDPVIGLMSHASQLWVDRSFAFDYLLKSLIKIAGPEQTELLRQLRRIIKTYAYTLLGTMLSIVNNDRALFPPGISKARQAQITILMHRWVNAHHTQYPAILLELMSEHFGELVADFDNAFSASRHLLAPTYCKLIENERMKWTEDRSWQLINQ